MPTGNPTPANQITRLAIIGSGPTSLYLIKELLHAVERDTNTQPFKNWQITVFERESEIGLGMPYHPKNTDIYNICNISSEELPELQISFVQWLRQCDADTLKAFSVDPQQICDDETYSRVALGKYFQQQWQSIIKKLAENGLHVTQRTSCGVADIVDKPQSQSIVVVTSTDEQIVFDRLVVATGHAFDIRHDRPEQGYFSSPWPIHKLLPKNDEQHCFPIGTLGASLSAFDVITSLAHRHGSFIETDDRLVYKLNKQAKGFKFTMHASNGWLPHLQYEQREAFREVYRHVSREEILKLRDDAGFLRLDRYFDSVCRPALQQAFNRDERADIADKLADFTFTLEDFVEQMTQEHTYKDAFEGMQSEMPQAEKSLEEDRPIHWKEVLDDLMYTLNYHAELMPAEDHLRFHETVMSFLMNVIAALPLQSAEILLALHEAGLLEIVAGHASVIESDASETLVEVADQDENKTEHRYKMFIDCTGQGALKIDEYPFQSLVKDGTIRGARAAFVDPISVKKLAPEDRKRVLPGKPPQLELGGIDIDSLYRVIDEQGDVNPRLHVIAFPHTTGIRPYSYGLQACSDTAAFLVEAWKLELDKEKIPDGSIEQATKLYEEV